MKKFTRILSLVLVALMVASSMVTFSFADEKNIIEINQDNWKAMGAKYSSATRLILKEKGSMTAKFQDFAFTRGENGSIEVDIPDYDVFKGTIPVAAVSSTQITPLDNLEVTMKPAEESLATIFETNALLYSGYYNMIWSEEPIDYIADEGAEEGYRGVGHADGAQFDGLRSIIPSKTLGMGVYVTNTHSHYSGTGIGSTVAVLCFDGEFTDLNDGYGLRYWFRARNYPDHSGWGDSSGIMQTYEAIETSEGITFKVRPDSTLGYVVMINGKEYSRGTDVAYFPNNTRITEVDKGQNDYHELAEGWTESYGYAKKDIDFSCLLGIEGGYVTAGLVGGDATSGTDLYNFSVESINGIPADDWAGEENDHEHVPGEWKKLRDPNCAIPGISVLNCTECYAVIEQQNTPCTDEHVLYDEWKTISVPTQTSAGRQIKGCVYHTSYVSESQNNPFTDVAFNKWYSDGVLYCYANGYMSGTSDQTFDYKVTMDRQMFATILAKVAVADTSSYTTSSFNDVETGKWYSNSIEWAYQNGYAAGVGEGVYGRKNPVTREQLAMFFYTYAEKNGVDVSGRTDVSGYADYDRIHEYALNAISWAVNAGLVSGTSDTTLSPRDSATRAQVSLIVNNFVENVLEPVVGCTVTFYAGDTAVCDEASRVVELGAAVGELPVPTNEGYVFDGWLYRLPNGLNTRATADTVITNSMTLVASWKSGTKVVFSAAYDSFLRPVYDQAYVNGVDGDLYVYIPTGTSLGRLPTPTLEGYNFHGWYLNGEKITVDTVFNTPGEVVLTPRFEVAPGQIGRYPDLNTTVPPDVPTEPDAQ
ncbi:MAG: S-layer homology domain-containing protein [Clostridia bacterium]|nr:S-layer homology domain-containing protein [Clostridia bacterium]